MRRAWDNLAAVFISFEFLIIMAMVLAYPFVSGRIGGLAASLGTDGEKIKWLALIPVALLGSMLASTKELLFPGGPNAQLLHDWPDYVMVRDRHVISLVSGTISSVLSVGVWMFCQISSSPLGFVVLATSIVVSMATFASYHLATVKIRSILNSYKAPSGS